VTRRLRQKFRTQGEDERIAYSFSTTKWGSNPTGVVVAAYDVSDKFANVSSTVLFGNPGVNVNVITTPTVHSLTVGHKYRFEIQFTCSDNTFETYFTLRGER